MAVKRITEAEMNEQGVIAAPDILNGTPAQNKAIFDRMVRQLVAPAVNACADAVEEVEKSQEEVTKNETVRLEAEQIRQINEEERIGAEQDRASNEYNRQWAEQDRQIAETERRESEQNRENAERSREEAEANRKAAEQARVDSTTGIVAQATEKANAAELSAMEASNQNRAAQKAATQAEKAEEQAEAHAENANRAVTAAGEQANNAQTAASVANNSRTEALNSKNAAQKAQEQAEMAAITAKGYSEGGQVLEGEVFRPTPGAKHYSEVATVYVEGGSFNPNPTGNTVTQKYVDGAENEADKAKAYAEGGEYQEWEQGTTPGTFNWVTKTVEKGAKQYAEEAKEAADRAGNTTGGNSVQVEEKIGEHNADPESHPDVRLLIEGLANRLNALADSDDTTLDQMGEVVAYIKANKTLIDSITTSKVNVSDIINNLTTNVANKPLSAAQGVILKELIDSLSTGKLDVTAIADWAKSATKPSYTKSEVGLGNVDNVKQYSASNPPPYPVTSVNGKTGEVQLDAAGVGARPNTWTPSAADVGADPEGTADAAVSDHNVDEDAHNDIRLLIEGLANRLNALADSDDTTLDQMSEIVAYIKANKSLIDSITTSKVNVSDIINNLTTNVTNKPLSAAQGVVLKGLIDSLSTGKLDVTAIKDWAKADTKPNYTKNEVGLGNVDNVKQYSASNPPPYPVTSVNGKTGAAQLSASDVGAVPTTNSLTVTGVDADGNTHTWTMYGVSV